MRFITSAVLVIVGAAALLFARPAEACTAFATGAAPGPVAAAPLDPAPVHAQALAQAQADERDYAQREAESPEVQEFVGGDCGFAWFILFAALVVVLVLYLQKENKI
jgi:hypothetical protein